MKLIVLLMIFLYTGSVDAESRLIIPLATTHIGGGDFDNTNPGIGFEYRKNNNYVYSATYLDQNSYSERSLYLAVSREFKYKAVDLSAGVAAASGYEQVTDSGILVVPVFSLSYKSFRIVTTWPSAQVFCPPDQDCGDFVNLQYVYSF